MPVAVLCRSAWINCVTVTRLSLQSQRKHQTETSTLSLATRNLSFTRLPGGWYEWEDEIEPHQQRIAANAAADGDEDGGDGANVNAAIALAANTVTVLTADNTILQVRKQTVLQSYVRLA